MDVKDYCSGMESELTAWKAKILDVAVRADKLGTAEKQRVWESFNDLKMIVADLESKIDQLRNECPTEWSPQKSQIEDATVDMRSKYEETMEYIGEAAPVSIPG